MLPDEVRVRLRLSSVGKDKRKLLPHLRLCEPLKTIDDIELWALCEICRTIEVEVGDVVMEAEEMTPGWYLVMQGSLAGKRNPQAILDMHEAVEKRDVFSQKESKAAMEAKAAASGILSKDYTLRNFHQGA